jgi:hypothetical protein
MAVLWAAIFISTPREITPMSNTQKTEILSKALAAALFRLGVGTAVFVPFELLPYTLLCRNQADGSIAVILMEKSPGPHSHGS